MRRLAAFVAMLMITTATLGALTAAPAAAATSCPPNPAPGSTVNGNLVVPSEQSCFLDHVTVTGNVVVRDFSSLSLQRSHINGSLTIGHLASLFMENSTVDNPVNATNGPRYVTILGGVGNGVTIVGALGGGGQGSFPAVVICGAHILNGLTVNATAAGQGPGEFQSEFFFASVVIGGEGCSSGPEEFYEGSDPNTTNRIDGSVNLRNNRGYVSFQDNTVAGGVNVFGNTGGGDLVDNVIANSLRCGSNEPPFYASGNKVQGTNTCGG
jgi:hypothetical protein